MDRSNWRKLWRIMASAALALCLVAVPAALAQGVTTGSLSGVITDEEGSTALPGATVTLIHQPTGTVYNGTSRDDGRFSFQNIRPGGPYTLTVEMDGFKTLEQNDLFVSLGQTTNLNLGMRLATVEEAITVTGESDPLLNPSRTGASSNISVEQLETGPTVRRQIQDFARLDPYFNVDSADQAASRITVAGRNNRYNQIQVDGAVYNDLFGLADTGTPGGQSDTQPISLDAVQQLQLVVSPYDVRQGGFTGGGINAVTRSGTNEFSGSVYGSTRDEGFVGDGPTDTPVANFGEDQYGLRLGGPIVRNKLFFFLSAERNKKDSPTGFSADGTSGQRFVSPSGDPNQAANFRNFLISRYSYDPGSLGDFSGATDSDLAFLRFDYNINASHQATLRHNYIDAGRDVIADRSPTAFRFESAIYSIADETNSTVFQLNSVFGNAFNEARIGYQTVDDAREVPVIFPTVDIGPISRRPEVTAGTERFSGANTLAQDVLEVTDDFTLVRGKHTLTVGTHNEFFDFENLFLSDFYGFYRFNTLADFQRGVAQEYSISFANGSDPRRPASFGVSQYGLYAGDQWQLRDNLSLVLGVRADMANLDDDPSLNPRVESAFGVRTNDVPSGNVTVSPRIGFNWAPDAKSQLRGGIGVFAGRTPYVWISNAYANTGIESTSLTARGSITFNPDPFNQPHSLGAAGAVTVDLIDPDFEYPQVLRATLGYDRELPWGLRGSIEAMLTQVQEDVFYRNINKRPTGNRSFDGRPTFTTVNTGFANAIELGNTSEGEQLNASVKLEKRFDFGLQVSTQYAYMDAESALDATSSRAISNFQFRPTKGDIFAEDTARSVFEIEHRFNILLNYGFQTGSVGHNLALFYNVQSGEPFSILEAGDPNTDGFATNDLLFVPANTSDVILRGVTPAQFDAFISAWGLEEYRGRIVDRNAFTEPWSRQLDLHYDIEVPISVVRTQITFDVLNLVNLIDNEKGVVKFVNNNSVTPITFSGIDAATGKPIYTATVAGIRDGAQFATADIRSRWQAKLGLRLSF